MIIQPYTVRADCKTIKAHYNTYKEWRADPRGYFTIKPFPDENLLKVRFHNYKHEITLIIEGKSAEEIYNTIVREKLITSLQHAAYIGSELMKAQIAMEQRVPYIQDGPLRFPKTDK